MPPIVALRRLEQPLHAVGDQIIEFGRFLTLFCEVQIDRGRAKKIAKHVDRAVEIMEGQPMATAPGEDGGEVYGEERANQMKARFEQRDKRDELKDDTESDS